MKNDITTIEMQLYRRLDHRFDVTLKLVYRLWLEKKKRETETEAKASEELDKNVSFCVSL